MPARIIEAKSRKSFSIRAQHEWNGIAAAVQKHTPWLEVHITTLGNRSWVFAIIGKTIWSSWIAQMSSSAICILNFLAYNVTKSDPDGEVRNTHNVPSAQA